MDSFFNNLQVTLGDLHKPIVLKRDDEASKKQIAYLESHRSAENNRKLAGFKKGAEGESNILYQLEHSGVGMYILHGIHIEDAQIDFVVITRGWTYFIESKNWSGNWKICKDGTVLIKTGTRVVSHESPIAQNQRHMDIVKQYWRQRNSRVANILFSSSFEKMWYKPLVVVSNYKSIINLKEAPKYDREHIVRADQLSSFIKNDLKKYCEQQPFASKKQMLELAEWFLKAEKEHQEKLAKQKLSNNTRH